MNFKAAQLENFCKNPGTEIKCVILFGNNEGEISAYGKMCAEAVCGDIGDAFRFCCLDMENVSKDGGEVYAEFHSQSLLGGRRAVLVKNADNNLTALLKNMIPDSPSDNLLILQSSSLNTRSSLISWAKDRSDVIIVGCYEDRDADIAEEAEKMLRERGLHTDAATMQILCSRLSPDKKLNQSEIDKLKVYLGERKDVTVEDIKAVISDVAGADFEDMCYYAAGGYADKAQKVFNRLLKEGEDPAVLVRQLSYHFIKLLDCSALMESGSRFDEAIKSIRPPLMFYRKNEFMRQMQLWNKERILGALKLLYECERDCKTTNMPAEQCAGYTLMRLATAVKKFH